MSDKIPATEINEGPPASGGHAPVVCVYSKGDREAEQSTLEFFRNLGWHSWSPGSEDRGSKNGGDGCADLTLTGPEQLGRLLIEHDERHPGHPLLLVDAGLTVTATAVGTLSRLMNDLAPAEDQAVVLTALSNADSGLNPYSGLAAPLTDESTASEWESIVALLGQGRVYEHHRLPPHLLFFSASAIKILAQTDIKPENALSRYVCTMAACSWRTIVSYTIRDGGLLTRHPWNPMNRGGLRLGEPLYKDLING